jgi:hypothetical protein
MQRHGWHIKAFHELPSDSPDRGVMVTRTIFLLTSIGSAVRTRCEYKLSVQLRYSKHHDRLIRLKEVLMAVCHELAHMKQGDRFVDFFRLNRNLVDELNEKSKGGKVAG